MRAVKAAFRKIARRLGYDLLPTGASLDAYLEKLHADIDDDARQLFRDVQPFTMSGIERVFALREAVKYILKNNISGDIVECGVWKGGSMMAIAKTLLRHGCRDRHLYLFDTFAGMTAPTHADVDFRGMAAANLLDAARDHQETANIWAIAPLEMVRDNIASTGYDLRYVACVKGPVEETIPSHAPARIALLRLDTDWYESTYHEMVHLYPRLTVGGAVIVDDYGHWQGARRAVDQYVAEKELKVLLHRIDYTARIFIKVDSDS